MTACRVRVALLPLGKCRQEAGYPVAGREEQDKREDGQDGSGRLGGSSEVDSDV